MSDSTVHNLLVGSWDLSTVTWGDKAKRSDERFHGAAVADLGAGQWGISFPTGSHRADARETSGAEYVLSFWARADVAGDKIHSEVWGSVYMLDAELTTEWRQVTMPYGIANADDRTVFFWGLDTNSGSVHVALPMANRGTTPAAWAPAEGETLAGGGALMSANLWSDATANKHIRADGTYLSGKTAGYLTSNVTGVAGLTDNQTIHMGASLMGAGMGVLKPYVRYKDAAGNLNWTGYTSWQPTETWQRFEATCVVPSGMTVDEVGFDPAEATGDIEVANPVFSYGSPIVLASSAHTPYATQDHVSVTYATKASLKVTSDSITAEVSARAQTDRNVADLSSRLTQTANSLTSEISDRRSAIATVTELANTAQSKADAAKSSASDAVSTANSASSSAASAVDTANSASSAASAASTAASKASTDAANAVKTANSASSTASGAVTTANEAVTTANAASDTATAAQTMAVENQSSIKQLSDSITAEVTERSKLSGRVGTLESTTDAHTSKLEQLATSIKSLVKGESTYTDPDGNSATSGIYSLVTQTREAVTALFGDYTKTSDLSSTQAVMDAKKAGTDAQAAASAAQTTADSASSTAGAAKSTADLLATMIRADSTGIMVGKSADGKTYSTGRTHMDEDSFDVLDNAGNVLSSFGKSFIELGKNSTSAIIKFCAGAGQISTFSDGSLYLAGTYGAILQRQTDVDNGNDYGIGLVDDNGKAKAVLNAEEFLVAGIELPPDNLRSAILEPHVTGTGSSGDWHWRIWSDGRRELWGRFETKISYAGQNGDNYLSDPSTVNFPFTFTSVADFQFTGQCAEFQLMATDCTTSSFTWRGWSWWNAADQAATLNVYVDGTV